MSTTEFQRGFQAGLLAASQWLQRLANDVYPTDRFPPPAAEADMAQTADVLRDFAPKWANAIRNIDIQE